MLKICSTPSERGTYGGSATTGTAATDDVLTTVTLDGYGASSTITSDALTTLNLSNSGFGVAVTTASTGSIVLNTSAITGGAAINLDSGTSGATITDLTINALGTTTSAVTAAAAETITLNATGDLDLTGSTLAAATDVVVTGGGDVTLAGLTLGDVNIDASQATGAVDYTEIAPGATLGTAGVYTGGSGADTIAVDLGTEADHTLGAGDDVVTLTGTALAAVPADRGSIDAGAGEDTVIIGDAAAQGAIAAENALLTNFEKLQITGLSGAVELGILTFDNVALDGAGSGAALNDLPSGGTVEFLVTDSTVNVNVVDAATGTADVLNVVMTGTVDNSTAGAQGTGVSANITAADVETINIASNNADPDGVASANGVTLATGTTATTVNVSGSAPLNLGSVPSVTTINASAATGSMSLTSNTGNASTITGGSGNDVILGNAANDVLIGGAGNDTLTPGVNAQGTTLTGGAGSDTFVIAGVQDANGYATITDLQSGDRIQITKTDTSATPPVLSIAFTGVETELPATASFQDYVNRTVDDVVATATEDAIGWFQFGGDTYLVVDASDDTGLGGAAEEFTDGTDQIIQITGLVDLSTAVFNSTTTTVGANDVATGLLVI